MAFNNFTDASWLDKINTDLKITFADGKSYYPKWVNAQRKYESNYTEFLFRGVKGSLIDRRLNKGMRYEVELYFDNTDIKGLVDDCIFSSTEFMKSSMYSSDNIHGDAFDLIHPFYGHTKVQHTGFEFDNSEYNVTKITGTLIHTLTKEGIEYNCYKPQNIIGLANGLATNFNNEYNLAVTNPTAHDILSQSKAVNALYESETGFILIQSDFEEFENAFNTALGYIQMGQNALDKGINTMAYIQHLMLLPATFTMTVLNRISFLQNTISGLLISPLMSLNDKILYEQIVGILNTGMYVASVTNITNDYDNVSDVLGVINILINNYNLYLSNIDSMQSANGGVINGYIPNGSNLQALTDLYLFTIDSLYDIAANSKKQYTVYLSEDSNVILIAYQYLGLQPDDSTIDNIIKWNVITLDELILVRKGRKIIYYI